MICADAIAQDHVLDWALGYMGTDIILLMPSAWAIPPDHDRQKEPYGKAWRQAYQPVARELATWMVAGSTVGVIEAVPGTGWKRMGGSLVVNSEGRPVLQDPYGDQADTLLLYEGGSRAPSRPRNGVHDVREVPSLSALSRDWSGLKVPANTFP